MSRRAICCLLIAGAEPAKWIHVDLPEAEGRERSAAEVESSFRFGVAKNNLRTILSQHPDKNGKGVHYGTLSRNCDADAFKVDLALTWSLRRENIVAVTRRLFLSCAATASLISAVPRKWPLGINTYCLRFQRWNDRQLIDYCVQHKLDGIFLQDSIDPGIMDPAHWREIRAWTKDARLRIETGGGAILPKTSEDRPKIVATLRKNIERAVAVGSPIVRALLASDRYAMPPGPVERHIETTAGILREVRSQVMDAGLKIGIENHKELQAWETRQLIEMAGKEFVGSYLDTGNPVFVAEHPLTTIEELAPYAVTFHLRDSAVYEHPDGIAVQWVPLGEGTPDFKKLVARAAELMPEGVYIYCKPITARPPVVLPVYTDEFWTKWFPRGRSRDFARFAELARGGKPYDQPHLTADVPGLREAYMGALKIQQLEHMERSLAYCRKNLELGVRVR